GLLPFAVVGSMEEVKVGKRMVKGRHYPWGVLQEFQEQCKREEEELKQMFMQRVKEKELTFKDAEKEA
ncbi:hypothetical protein A6R68_03023, partial [Neotoma lepida]